MEDGVKRLHALVEDVKKQANELFKDEYCRGQFVYAKIAYAKLEDYEDSDIPSDILELKNFTDNAGNINEDKLDSLKKSCVVGFDIHRDDYSELLDVSKFSRGLASSFYLTNAHFDSEENMPTISCDAVFFMPIAEGIDKINFDMSDNPIEYFEEGFELFIPIDGEYGVPPAERCFYDFGDVLELNIDKQNLEEELNDNEKDGQITMTFDEGKYIGEIKNNKRHGQGILYYINEAKYEGEWKDNKRNGKGTFTYANGETYTGEYKDDKMHGLGTFHMCTGCIYEGEYKDNVRDGQGTFSWPDGENYKGEFKKNLFNGQGTYTTKEGEVTKGLFKDGREATDD